MNEKNMDDKKSFNIRGISKETLTSIIQYLTFSAYFNSILAFR